MGEETAQTASLRQWVRLVAVYLLIPVALLICGGDLGWWQAWLYCLLIVVFGIGGRIWAEQRHPGLMAERQSIENIQKAKAWDKVLAPLMAVSVAYPMVVVAGLDHRYGWSAEFPLWLIAAGFFLTSLGYGFAAWAIAENRFFFSVVCIRTDLGHTVCDSGPVPNCAASGLRRKHPCINRHRSCFELGMDTDPSSGGNRHRGDQNRA